MLISIGKHFCWLHAMGVDSGVTDKSDNSHMSQAPHRTEETWRNTVLSSVK